MVVALRWRRRVFPLHLRGGGLPTICIWGLAVFVTAAWCAGYRLRGMALSRVFGIEGGLVFEHGAGDGDDPVGDGS